MALVSTKARWETLSNLFSLANLALDSSPGQEHRQCRLEGACAWSAVTWQWSKSETGSQARVGHTWVLGHRSNVETGVASWEGTNKEINLEAGFEGVGW